jgi:methylphosphotriester-DNA--protein-cysteine methyltransferase
MTHSIMRNTRHDIQFFEEQFEAFDADVDPCSKCGSVKHAQEIQTGKVSLLFRRRRERPSDARTSRGGCIGVGNFLYGATERAPS